MLAESAVYNILANTSAITTLVGTRTFLGLRKQGTGLPAILIEPDGIDPTDEKPGGSLTGVSHLDEEDVIVFSYGGTLTEAQSLSQAVRTALDKKTAGTYNNVIVQSVRFLDQTYFNEQADPQVHVYEDRYRLRIIR